ncbi:MAG: Z1 domain-containing protein [bacterium]|nr:Z1 domain-containing protein [bacterium]
MPIQKGNFYNTLTANRKDDDALKACIEETVEKLMASDTSTKKPGILLGKVQSGKTRTFLGVMALAFDNGYDIAIILTKGTKPLTEQTLKRLHEDFGQFEEDNKAQVYDIMFFPKNMKKFELTQKLIIVAKKEVNNLKRTLDILINTYPNLKAKKVLIIDDEADFASVSFHKEKETGLVDQGRIAKQIDEIRTSVENSDFLQVTATPYSLYLQPADDDENDSGLFPPKKPAFTVIVKEYKDYIGGDYYFIQSQDDDSPASHVYNEVDSEELEALKANKKSKRADRRSFKIEDVFTSQVTKTLRKSIMNFIVGGCIRRSQQENAKITQENYSFITHTEQSRISHSWQEDLVNKLNEELINITKNNQNLFERLVKDAYNDLKISITLANLELPEFADVFKNVSLALTEEMLLVQKVNSEKDVKTLLDEKGQLRLRTPLNIFIGGQILDRGITINHVVGFYYGRNPKKFQQDTVLQHSRMYGARSKEDLAVTRFYTTRGIYEIMRRIHEFDNTLREAFLNGSHDKGVYFIRKDASDKLAPCSPNKIMLSNITTLKPYKRLLPIGFQTDYKSNIKKNIEELDKEIDGLKIASSSDHFMIPIEQALGILDKIQKTFVFEEEGYDWDIKAHKASLEHLSKNSLDDPQKGKVWVVIRTDSNISRKKADGRFSDDVGSGTGETALVVARKIAENIPALILVRQNGKEEQGWMGSPFWWPVIIAPKNTLPTIFASETVNNNQ